MGRVKVELKKIENKSYRQITFAKRKNGLVKKAYELSTLCDVEVALIIFSPAGKLFLFDGNKRIEEILAHFIDIPTRRRGWLQNQELIKHMVAKMSLEAGSYSHQPPTISRIHKLESTIIDPQLQNIQKEILSYSTKLENVEKQLEYFLRYPSFDKSMSEIRRHELILEETLKVVHFRKLLLQANHIGIQPTSPHEFQDHVHAIRPHLIDSMENARAEGSILSRGLNYNLMKMQSRKDLHAPGAFTRLNGFQLSRNLAEPLVEDLPSPMTYLQGHPYIYGMNEVNGQPKRDGYMHHPAVSGTVYANFPPRMNNFTHQARAATSNAADQCEAGSSMRTFCQWGNVSNPDGNVWFRH